MKTILLATDGSPSAASAADEAVALAAALGAKLVIASVEELGSRFSMYEAPELDEDLRAPERARVDRLLEEAAETAAARGVTCETAHLLGPVAEEICEEAARKEASLVVVGSHGWGSLGRVLHGSVSSEVLHRAHCPVLVVRAAAHSSALDLPAEARSVARS